MKLHANSMVYVLILVLTINASLMWKVTQKSEFKCNISDFFPERYLKNDNSNNSTKISLPLNKPGRSEGEILRWAVSKVTEAMSLSSENYEDHIDAISNDFNDYARNAFVDSVKRSRILEPLRKNKKGLIAIISGKPIIQDEGNVGGKGIYRWRVSVPIEWVYSTGEQANFPKLNVTLGIVRSNEEKHPFGLVIDLWQANSK